MRYAVPLLLMIFTLMPSVGLANEAGRTRPLVGAIRWDAWFRDSFYQKFLYPEQWHYRLPFYGKVISPGETLVCSNTQGIMDKEIGLASKAGLDYWAFDYYVPGSFPQAESYNYGTRLYLSSKLKNDLEFCLILLGSQLGPRDKWRENAAEIVKLFKEPTYQKVCGGRPLVFAYSLEKLEPKYGSLAEARKLFDELREMSVKAGAGDPYVVAQVWWAPEGVRYCDALEFQAVSAYSIADVKQHKELPYSELAKTNADYWDSCKATGRPVVPIVNTGWDGRPLTTDPNQAQHYKGAWYAPAKPSEIADNLRAAIKWVHDNPESATPNAILIYAWNETAEGGWLVPTLAEGAARLDAIGTLLKRPN